MSYQPYLIANYATGLNRELQPWLSPDDAQEELFDGYVYDGVLYKRQGYSPLATGGFGGQAYTESRMVNSLVNMLYGVGDGTAGPYDFTAPGPIRRGVAIVITAGAQTATFSAAGVLTTNPVGGSGSINYFTGAISVTFANVVANGVAITTTLSYHPGEPVMGIMNFVTQTNTKTLLVADTKRVNIYNGNTNILEYAGATRTIASISTANPATVTTTANHNLLTGDRVFIYGFPGTNPDEVNNLEFTITVTGVTTFTIGAPYTGVSAAGGTVQLIYSGTKYKFWSWVNYSNGAGDPRLIFTNNKDEVQYYDPALTPAFGDYVNYPTAASPQFFMFADDGTTPIISLAALQVFEYKDRLIMIRTTENGTVRPKRIRISGTGASSDDFRTSATGAGFIDIPDGSWIQGATYNRDDLIIFTERSTWILKYTGNDTTPFTLDKIDESRGSGAAFSAITYLNRSSAASPRGLIITDGYKVERADDTIPDFSYNEIDPNAFELCFAGVVDEDRDHYLLYPPINQTDTEEVSKRILVTNYKEDNYAIYRYPLSCMGIHQQSTTDVTWNDLTYDAATGEGFENWDALAETYGDWNSFSFSKGSEFSIAGGHKGEVWSLNKTQIGDNPQKIRNITKIDRETLEITTDWNNYSLNADDPDKGADYIYLNAVLGMTDVNNQQYPITSVTSNYVFRVRTPDNTNFAAYTSGGVATRVIPFVATFKKFNPFANNGQKVRCGWIYFYVSSSSTALTNNLPIVAATQANPCVITTGRDHNLEDGTQINIFSVTGMTELNDLSYYVTVISPNQFSLNGIDSTLFTAYVSGGIAAAPEGCKLEIDIYRGDQDEKTQPAPNPDIYVGNCSTLKIEAGDSKKWYRVWVNQVGTFIQFALKNRQAGAKIEIQATMPGFAPIGRLS